MDKTVRIVTDPAEQQAETFRFWQSVLNSKRLKATWTLTLKMYPLRSLVGDAQGLQRSLVRVQRP